MNNIFKNAYLGKVYKMRDEKKGIYSRFKPHRNCHEILTEAGLYDYNNDGSLCGFTDISNCDIVSEWNEEINEEELDKLAMKYIFSVDGSFRINELVREAFKAGYRKALEN